MGTNVCLKEKGKSPSPGRWSREQDSRCQSERGDVRSRNLFALVKSSELKVEQREPELQQKQLSTWKRLHKLGFYSALKNRRIKDFELLKM